MLHRSPEFSVQLSLLWYSVLHTPVSWFFLNSELLSVGSLPALPQLPLPVLQSRKACEWGLCPDAGRSLSYSRVWRGKESNSGQKEMLGSTVKGLRHLAQGFVLYPLGNGKPYQVGGIWNSEMIEITLRFRIMVLVAIRRNEKIFEKENKSSEGNHSEGSIMAQELDNKCWTSAGEVRTEQETREMGKAFL